MRESLRASLVGLVRHRGTYELACLLRLCAEASCDLAWRQHLRDISEIGDASEELGRAITLSLLRALLLLPHTIPGTDPVALPIATGRSQKPILGEIAAAPSGHDFPWHELRGRDAGDARSRVRERLFAAEQKGYEVVLLWPDLGNDGLIRHDSLKYSDEALDGIRDFSAGRRGPK